ncbi:GTPase Rab11/YPT3 [Moesziomyces antarcticus T-34]|uniref:GTPase Rab11/YPT3 n=1 Tax=Pseudozyma antarctica (strain T-34) TaxID=1151754 RepID=M9M0N2_PSEA3|nr:GTPase Rab11/YPT3 [Moesziomyces antarcticus T-34]
MTSIFSSKSLGRRRGSAQTGELSDSSASSRNHSISSRDRSTSLASSQMDDWTDGFTGIVDLDRQMRQLAMAEQGHASLCGSSDLDVYEPYSPSSWLGEHEQRRRKSSSDARLASGSQSSLSTRSIPPSPLSPAHTTASTSTAATSRFSNDSRTHSSLLAKRQSSRPSRQAQLRRRHGPTPPRRATSPRASLRAAKKSRPLRKKTPRAPLPRLVSGEVVSSPTAESECALEEAGAPVRGEDEGVTGLGFVLPSSQPHAPSGTHAIRRSAQSLALSLRFKMLRAKRRVRRTGQEAAELFTPQSSRRSSLDTSRAL